MKSWDELTEVEQLQEHFSDFHKDVHGFRPRWMTDEQWVSKAWLEQSIQELHQYCATPEYQAQREAEDAYFQEQQELYTQEIQQHSQEADLLAPLTLAEYAQQAADLDCIHYGMKG
jgi:hypothetical protein